MQRKQFIPRFKPGQEVTGKAAAVVNAGRFVKISGDKTTDGAYRIIQCILGNRAFGVSENNSADPATENAHSWRLDVKVNRKGCIARIEPGAAVTAGDYITSDANGKAITATTGKWINGQAVETAAGTDAFVEVDLFDGGLAA